MKRGAVSAERVSRRFRVHPQRTLTLKEAIVRRSDLRARDIWALRDVSFEIEPGESVGLIGRNGSGKTTLLRLVAGIFRPTDGRMTVEGSVGSLLGLGAGFHPEFTGRENVYLNGAIHGLKRRYVRERMEEIVDFAELEPFIDLPVRTYSSGMYMRLGFAIATHLDSDVLLLDEVFAVGDESFQRKCFGKIFDFKGRGGTIIFVSHSAAAVESLCERAILLRAGEVAYDGETHEAITRYHRMLSSEEAPAEREAGLQEWGTGGIRIDELRVEDSAGEERQQFLAGEPMRLSLRLVSEQPAPAPRLSVEFRPARGALFGAAIQDLSELGWSEEPGTRTIVLEVERPSFADGRFEVSATLSGPDGTPVFHHVERAAEFLVYPGREVRGPALIDGEWSLAESGVSGRT